MQKARRALQKAFTVAESKAVRTSHPLASTVATKVRKGGKKADERGRRLRPVKIRIRSRPVAELYAAGRQGALCQTPCALTIDPGDGDSSRPRVYFVKKRGYRSQKIVIDLDSPRKQISVDLKKWGAADRERPGIGGDSRGASGDSDTAE